MKETWCLLCRNRCGGGSWMLNVGFGMFLVGAIGGVVSLISSLLLAATA